MKLASEHAAATALANPDEAPIEAAIKGEAAALGFVLCGIAAAELPPYHVRYRDWLADGFAGEMSYLERQEPKRAEPSLVLPNVRSAVVVALNYTPPPNPAATGSRPVGAVARYARFDDYHDTIWSRLSSLLAFIRRAFPDCHGRVYCDTGPITERDLAMRAGIGWIGKHTNLIGRRLGNWFFLGEILLDIPLTPDAPETTHCGTCTRCIPACPTGAIVAPYRLDARRCISYLTIELKGSIPEPLRPLIGNRIYGCDDCLAACPWNRFATVSNDPAVQPRDDLTQPDLIALLSIDEDGFAARFAASPIKRTKRRGLLRNVCVALGNVGGEESLEPLRMRRDFDVEPLVREHAAWAVTQIERRLADSARRTSAP